MSKLGVLKSASSFSAFFLSEENVGNWEREGTGFDVWSDSVIVVWFFDPEQIY